MNLKGAKVLTIVSPEFDDLELWYPIIRLRESKVQVDIAAEKANFKYFGKDGVPVYSDISFNEVDISQYDALLIPGGWAPDYLRRLDSVLNFVKYMDKHNRVIGIICHAGWVLSSANILTGRTVTSTPGIKDDLMYAGAKWINEASVIDGNIVSGRRPPDLPAYLPLVMDAINKRRNN